MMGSQRNDRLHPDDIALIADAVAERLRHSMPVGPELLDSAAVAQLLGMGVDWVRLNAERLGAVRLGTGPKARLRFDRQRIEELATAQHGPRARQRRRRRATPRSGGGVTAAGNPLLPDPGSGPL